MKINNDAVSPVVSVVVVLMIVISTMATIVFWGVPYIKQLENSSKKEDFNKQFASIVDTIDDLASSTAGDRRINPINVYDGSLQVEDANIGDRTIVSYSQNSNYNFIVSGLDTCFLAGTRVLMADKSYKNIEEINTDDVVLSYDEQTKGIVTCRVTNAFHHAPEEMTNYYLVVNNVLKVTPNHRFYSNGKWIYACDLKAGDKLFNQNQSNYYIYSIKKVYERVPTFDLEVGYCHTYFVSIDDGVNVLVHNNGGYVWVTPKLDEATSWSHQERARDNDAVTSADYQKYLETGWSDWLILKTSMVIPCSGFRINARHDDAFTLLQVEMLRSGTQVKIDSISNWDNNNDPWFEFPYDTNAIINTVRIRFYLEHSNYGVHPAKVFEFQFKVPVPECQTLPASGVGTTSATLNGQVTDWKGIPCYYQFVYSTDPNLNNPHYFTLWSDSTVGNDEIFSMLIPQSGHWPSEPLELASGTLYYFKAQVFHNFYLNNIGSSEKLSFFTKPTPPSNLQSISIKNNSISYSWAKTICGNNVDVYTKILAKTSGWASDPEDITADEWYNDTGSSDSQINLIPGQRYNISMWTWAVENELGIWRKWSDIYNNFMYTKPSDLSYLNAASVSSSEIQLSWVKSEGSHKTVIRRSITDFPSTPNSGDEIYNDTGISWIDNTIPDPVENYYYSAWAYDNDSGYFSDDYATAYVEMVYNIAITSPKEGYKWKVGTTQAITWLFGEDFSETRVKIGLMKVGTTSTVPESIAIDVDIKAKSFNWSIPFDHAIGEYTINISAMDDSIFDESKKFRIDSRYEGIVDNVTKILTIMQGQTITIDLPDTTSHNIPIKGDRSFTLEMISGQVDRFEIYWLYYNKGLNYYSLKGTVCIDLYDRNNWFGSIWIFDSTPITYLPSSSGGLEKVTIEKGGIINYEDVTGQLQRKPPYIYEGNGVFAIHIIQAIASSFAASGSGNFRYKVYSNLYRNSAMEEGKTVFNLRLQFYGDNTEVWLKYFVDNYEFNPAGENTLFYAPSAPMEGVKFSFAHATVELEIQI